MRIIHVSQMLYWIFFCRNFMKIVARLKFTFVARKMTVLTQKPGQRENLKG